MIHKSPTRRPMPRPSYQQIPQSPVIRSGKPVKRKNSTTPLSTPISVSSTSLRNRHASPTQSPMVSSPTRTSSGSSSRGKTSDGMVNLDSIWQNGASQQYRGTISVSIRVKPSESRFKNPWRIGQNHTISHEDHGEFKFDNVFQPESSNTEVYEGIGKPLIDRLFEGYNGIVFAYGMTESGKTYTMSGTAEEAGLILLSVRQIYDRINNEQQDNTLLSVKVSYLEIYNEKIYDLLNYPDHRTGSSTFAPRTSQASCAAELQIRDDSKNGVRVVGLTEQSVHTTEELMRFISVGNSNRRTGETDYNARSSRSHTIVSITLTRTNVLDGTETSSTLSLCDLAGSEKAAGQQERRKEGAFINKSLLALGTVISKLSAGCTHPNSSFGTSHIPYRDSKLTRILQPALSGESIVTTICTIDTKLDSVPETVNTIRFATRAKDVSMTVRRNEAESNTAKDKLVNSLKRQIDEQQEIIWELRQQSSGINDNPTATAHLMRWEYQTMKAKLQHCERLLDKDDTPVQDENFLEIVEMLPPAIGAVLETKIQGLESKLREHQAYNAVLERKLKKVEQQLAGEEKEEESVVVQAEGPSQQLLKEQEEEIHDLRRALTRKNKMLEALQSAKRLREGALRPLNYENRKLEDSTGRK
ncbi:LAFA_0B05644g1_1 [Lachancea sp. 'fantastica']|nr:LAFA_0B05644g1_1 [Lachancea sp. 'fantastica']